MFCTVADSRRHRLLVDNLLALAHFIAERTADAFNPVSPISASAAECGQCYNDAELEANDGDTSSLTQSNFVPPPPRRFWASQQQFTMSSAWSVTGLLSQRSPRWCRTYAACPCSPPLAAVGPWSVELY